MFPSYQNRMIIRFVRFLKDEGAYQRYKERFLSSHNRMRVDDELLFGVCQKDLRVYLKRFYPNDFMSLSFQYPIDERWYWVNLSSKWQFLVKGMENKKNV